MVLGWQIIPMTHYLLETCGHVFANFASRLHICHMSLGTAIRALREQKHWSQEELGFRVDTSATNISRIENGKYRPGPEVMQDLAREFGVKVHELYALAEGEPLPLMARLPEQAETLLVERFRAMTEERRRLMLELSATLAGH